MTPEQIAAKDAEHGGPGWRTSRSVHRRNVAQLPPASKAAADAGCLCPGAIYINPACPLHGNAR